MKKIYFYLAVASFGLFTITSCSDDEKAGPEPTKDVFLGKWDLKTLSSKVYINGDLVEDVKEQPVEGKMTLQFDFKADNKVDYYMYAPATEDREEVKVDASGSYKKNGTELTITIEGEDQIFKIEGNDAENLKLMQSVEFKFDEATLKQDVTFNFKKM